MYLYYFCKFKLTELFRARDASCPKGKKMEKRCRKLRICRDVIFCYASQAKRKRGAGEQKRPKRPAGKEKGVGEEKRQIRPVGKIN